MSDTCIIFDLDGTLVDSEVLSKQAILDVVPDLDDTLEEVIRRYRGLKLEVIISDIENRLGRALPAGFEEDYRTRVAALFENDLRVMPGVLEMLDSLDIPCCLASSGPLVKINQALRVTGLAPYFGDKVFSSYEIGSWKPEPDLLLHAARQMGFEPEACDVVEDSDPGIEAAVRAGMGAYLYTPGGHDDCEGTAAAVRFTDMRELPTLLRGCQTGGTR